MISTRSLEIFKEITTIPRESGHEGPMTAFLQDFAAKRGLFCKTDSIGNVVIVREAMPGKEQVPTIVLQCHQDMVCEKNPGVEHDFSRDPISYVVEDGWMIAPDTTLGADDGIGIAAALAVLDAPSSTWIPKTRASSLSAAPAVWIPSGPSGISARCAMPGGKD